MSQLVLLRIKYTAKSFRLLTNQQALIFLPISNDTIQIIIMEIFARVVVDLNFNGKQIAYHRSTEMKVRVSTETATETVWKQRKFGLWQFNDLFTLIGMCVYLLLFFIQFFNWMLANEGI